jgi:hypothetical protein
LKNWIKILVGIVIVVFDLFVYIILGLLLMNYDDFYNESKGEYWSFESMTTSDKLAVIGLNFWHVVNLISLGAIIYKLIKKFKARTTEKSNGYLSG